MISNKIIKTLGFTDHNKIEYKEKKYQDYSYVAGISYYDILLCIILIGYLSKKDIIDNLCDKYPIIKKYHHILDLDKIIHYFLIYNNISDIKDLELFLKEKYILDIDNMIINFIKFYGDSIVVYSILNNDIDELKKILNNPHYKISNDLESDSKLNDMLAHIIHQKLNDVINNN